MSSWDLNKGWGLSKEEMAHRHRTKPLQWTPAEREAARLAATGRYRVRDIARITGISMNRTKHLQKNPYFKEKVEQLMDEMDRMMVAVTVTEATNLLMEKRFGRVDPEEYGLGNPADKAENKTLSAERGEAIGTDELEGEQCRDTERNHRSLEEKPPGSQFEDGLSSDW